MAATVLSVSSQVAFGPVGNSAAVPAMEALGLTVYAVPTIVLSHHPGHAKPAGLRVPAADFAAILASLLNLGVLDGLGAVLTGYFAANDQIFSIARLIAQLKQKNPELVYLCDPIIGSETSKLYVPLPVAEAIRSSLLPLADIITPNAFELAWLSGSPIASVDDVKKARRSLDAKSVIAKSVPQAEDRMLTILTGERGEVAIETARRAAVPRGTGDLLSGLFLAHLLNGLDGPNALRLAIAMLDKVIEASIGASALNLSVLRAMTGR
jgi:pyridoxine kinase